MGLKFHEIDRDSIKAVDKQEQMPWQFSSYQLILRVAGIKMVREYDEYTQFDKFHAMVNLQCVYGIYSH